MDETTCRNARRAGREQLDAAQLTTDLWIGGRSAAMDVLAANSRGITDLVNLCEPWCPLGPTRKHPVWALRRRTEPVSNTFWTNITKIRSLVSPHEHGARSFDPQRRRRNRRRPSPPLLLDDGINLSRSSASQGTATAVPDERPPRARAQGAPDESLLGPDASPKGRSSGGSAGQPHQHGRPRLRAAAATGAGRAIQFHALQSSERLPQSPVPRPVVPSAIHKAP